MATATELLTESVTEAVVFVVAMPAEYDQLPL
jgi:hypothetical protein